jgi:hypothetical protein
VARHELQKNTTTTARRERKAFSLIQFTPREIKAATTRSIFNKNSC